MCTNTSVVTEFILAGFSHLASLQGLLFSLFLTIYLLTVAGNLLIVVLVSADSALRSPMYFFLRILSALEIGYTSVTVPLLLHHLLTGQRHISRSGCALQMFFFLFFGATECCLLAAMAYDRYAAICKPLHYPLLLSHRMCLQLAGSAWACGAMVGLGHTSFIFSLPFCGPNAIPHFFCEIQPILQLVCGDTSLNELQIILAAALIILCPFGLILGSYGSILATIFRIPSAAGRCKAFSTCSSHLVVVSLFYSTAIFIYIRPKASYDPATDPLLSLFYAVVTPILNPIIYSLRNTDVKAALKRTIQKMKSAEI
ncbi:olfactory receptor 10C1 [Equus przewalskii]|uniref:Olfactory receptor n=1 Tax=Equus przewalskii TaxID=9798 RepID=A0ABM2FG84_EQUPR|nr:olfactory receptor family 10 subfamily C member 1 [Equus caballus]XP_008537571.1 PREDICTED: olfactory receptor 10C1 [Equus przewalskii]